MLEVRLLAIALATTASLAAVTGPATVAAQPTASGKNGRIVFVGPSPNRLWLINPDGTGYHKLTVTKGPGLEDEDPDWSPDGSKIAFSRCTRNGPCQVWTIAPDGTGLRRVGPSGEDRAQPAWSPDGRSIAYSRFWGGDRNDQIKFAEIFVMDAAGGSARQVTHVTTAAPFSADVEHPVWAPDGKSIVFEVHTSSTGEPAKRRALFVIGADGSESRQLTPWSLNGSDPDWSPDGRLILFRSVSGREQHGDLYTVDPDGTGLKQLTRYPFPKAVYPGSFSPDGKWITFSRFWGNDPYPAIFVMQVNGSGVRQLTPGGYNVAPDWGPA
jgi:Tol biopolymer transport system component